MRTDFFSHVNKAGGDKGEGDKTYKQLMDRSSEIFFNSLVPLASTVEQMAGAIFDATTDGTDKVRYPIGKDTEMFLAERRIRSDEEWEKYIR